LTIRFLLDTNIVSNPISKVPNTRIVKRLERSANRCAIPAPVWHELIFGCQRLPRGKRRRALESYLVDVVQASFPILPYDGAAASWHAMERARLERAGKAAPHVDGQIASIAHQAGLILVTLNAKDFRLFKGLDVVDWTKRGH